MEAIGIGVGALELEFWLCAWARKVRAETAMMRVKSMVMNKDIYGMLRALGVRKSQSVDVPCLDLL